MKKRLLGQTGLSISEIGFGGWAIGGNAYGYSYGPTDDAESLQAITKALDLGCTFFDTADSYGRGHSETLFGQALKARRNDVILATKGGIDFSQELPRPRFTEAYLTEAVENSLRRLQTDTIDLYQLHHPPFSLIQTGHLFELLEKLKAQGKIRFFGLSVQHPEEGLLALGVPHLASVQTPYNYIHREAAAELFPTALAKGVGVVVAEALAQGFLSGKYSKESIFPPGDIRHHWPTKHQAHVVQQVEQFRKAVSGSSVTLAQSALRFVLAQPAVSCVLVGCKSPAQVEENFKASELVLQTV